MNKQPRLNFYSKPIFRCLNSLSSLDRERSSVFLRATRGERKSKIMQISGNEGREIRAERGKRTTTEILSSFELPFQWNGNSRLVGCLSIFQQQEHLSPKGVQFSLRLQLSQHMAKIDTGFEFEVFKKAYERFN